MVVEDYQNANCQGSTEQLGFKRFANCLIGEIKKHKLLANLTTTDDIALVQCVMLMAQHRLWAASRDRFYILWKMNINVRFRLVHVIVVLILAINS
jgi:hypothetical protein